MLKCVGNCRAHYYAGSGHASICIFHTLMGTLRGSLLLLSHSPVLNMHRGPTMLILLRFSVVGNLCDVAEPIIIYFLLLFKVIGFECRSGEWLFVAGYSWLFSLFRAECGETVNNSKFPNFSQNTSLSKGGRIGYE